MKSLFIFALVFMTLGKWAVVPNLSLLLMVFSLILLFNFVIKKHSKVFMTAIFTLLGVFVVAFHVKLYQHKIQIALSTNKNTPIDAKVISLVTTSANLQRITFKITKIDGKSLSRFDRFHAQLYWRKKEGTWRKKEGTWRKKEGTWEKKEGTWEKKEGIKQGQIWQIKARLREPYGRVNEAGFDAERYYLSQHIHSKGSVISAQLIENNVALRQQFYDWLYPKLVHFPRVRFLVALSFGERALLTSQDWSMLRNTGLAHLLAISGLHIGLAYCLSFYAIHFLKNVFLRRSRLLYAPYLFGLFFALCYSWLAGFSLPTERAVLALTLYTLIRICGFSIHPFALLLIVLCTLLAFDPLAVFSSSFWLSFSAVFILILFFTLSKRKTALLLKEKVVLNIKQLFFVQCSLLFGMLPVMVTYFNGLSLSGLFFNLLALPWVSFVVVPLVLLALVFSVVNLTAVWQLADLSLVPLIYFMQYSENHWISLPQLDLIWLCLIPILVLLLLYKLWRLPVFFASLLLVLLFWRAEKTASDAWQVDVLDVGHGLAVLISKKQEAILYDTGSAWKNGSIAEAVIAPILRKRGIVLTEVILSHSDKDHAGGLAWLTRHYPHIKVRAVQTQNNSLPCIAGETWQWQGLDFTVMFPFKSVSVPKNEHSCVIRVSNGKHALLLTGDLLKKQERVLIRQQLHLASTVLIVPHHGSKSSSSLAFLQAVNPEVAIVSRGRYTPWNLPSPAVVERYREQGIQWFDTAKQGQIRILFSGRGWQISTMRFDIHPYWYRNMFGALSKKQ